MKKIEEMNPEKAPAAERAIYWLPVLFLAAVMIFLIVRAMGANPPVMANAGDSLSGTPFETTLEIGSPLPALSDLIPMDLTYVTDAPDPGETIDMRKAGDYPLTFRILGKKATAILHVVHTKAPTVKTKNVQMFDFDGLDAMDFIESIEDATETTASFSIEPDEDKSGSHKVHISVWDDAGNLTEASAKLVIVADRQGPEIAGVQDITILVGGKVSYLETINVTDDYDPDPKLVVDNSEVNTEKEGNYPIVYRATDAAGNVTEETATLHVKRPTPGQLILTEEMIYAEADKILAKIITPEMNQYETAKAIFNWSHGNIAYIHLENKTDWLRGAWDGLVNKKGDCYVYAQASRALLTRAGIKNMIIHKIPAATVHYWNLIDIGEGWRHFDATRRRDGSIHFYETQEEIINYSNTHNLSHNYDKDLFPDIP